jgi:hypothetical protein
MTADLRLHVPSTIIISGPSQSGKTTLIERLLTEDDCFQQNFNEICWVHAPHAANNRLFEQLKDRLPIRFCEGYPDRELSDNKLFESVGPNLLVLDDVFVCPNTTYKSLFDLFNIISHHQNITVILTVQNLAGATPSQKSCLSTLLRSCSYLILFCSRRMTPVFRYISSNFFPGEQYRVLNPFQESLRTLESLHSYFVFDFVSKDEDLRIRCGGLVPSHRCYIYNHGENRSVAKSDEKSTARVGNSEEAGNR